MAETPLPSRNEIRMLVEGGWFEARYPDAGRVLRHFAEGRFVDRKAITENMVERMAESRYNARFGGFAWTDPDHVTNGYTRDAFMESARRDLVAALGVA